MLSLVENDESFITSGPGYLLARVSTTLDQGIRCARDNNMWHLFPFDNKSNSLKQSVLFSTQNICLKLMDEKVSTSFRPKPFFIWRRLMSLRCSPM